MAKETQGSFFKEAIRYVVEAVASGGYKTDQLVVFRDRDGKGKAVVDVEVIRTKLNAKSRSKNS